MTNWFWMAFWICLGVVAALVLSLLAPWLIGTILSWFWKFAKSLAAKVEEHAPNGKEKHEKEKKVVVTATK